MELDNGSESASQNIGCLHQNVSTSPHGIEYCYEVFPSEISWTLTIIGSFGAAANLVTIYILAFSPRMKISFKTFLIGLAVFDLLSCAAASFSLAQQKLPALLGNILYWIFNFGMSGSIWFTVLVTAERYTCVCMPLEHRSKFWTNRKIILAIAVFLSLDFTVNLPLGVLFIMKHLEAINYDCWKNTLLTVWSISLLMEFAFSVCLVVVLNTLIYRKIRRSVSFRNSITSHPSTESLREDIYTNLTVMVLCVYICLYIYPTVAILRCPQSLINLHRALLANPF